MYKSAGIYIIEKYKNNIVVVLFGKKNIQYCEPGGIIDPGETSIETACRETREESANLIKITPNELQQISNDSIIANKHISYIIHVNNLSINDYYNNINIIFNKCKHHHCWKENNDMVRIDLKLLINNSLKGINQIHDINNNLINLRSRIIDLTKNGAHKLLNKYTLYVLNRNLTTNSRMNCLNGTIYYSLNKTNNAQNIFNNIKKKHNNVPVNNNIQFNINTHNNLFNTNAMNKFNYAVCIVPRLKDKYKKLHLCNEYGKLHITMTSFSHDHPSLFQAYSNLFNDTSNLLLLNNWKICQNNDMACDIIDKYITVKSKTLNKIALLLQSNNFKKIKSSNSWHITITYCNILHKILKILKKVNWTYAFLIKHHDNTYNWVINKYAYVKKIN
jgi:hypothetical protein